jgi:hypothetical protein
MEIRLQALDLGAHLGPQLGVEGGERLVHQEHLGAPHDRPADRDPLHLAARQLVGPPVEQPLDVERAGGRLDARVDLALRRPHRAQRERQVLAHGHVRVQRERLEHERDVPVCRRQLGHRLLADADLAAVGDLQPGDAAQRRRLPAARGPRNTMNWPSSTSRSSRSTATVWSYRLMSCLTRTLAI